MRQLLALWSIIRVQLHSIQTTVARKLKLGARLEFPRVGFSRF